MSTGFRPLVFGGTVVAGLLLASSLLAASPEPLPQARTGELRLPKPVYSARSYDFGRDKVLRDLGVQKEVLVAAENSSKPAIQIPDSAKKAQAKAAKLQAKVQVASRSADPNANSRSKARKKGASSSASPAVNQGLIPYALSLQGVPYRWGGSSPAGFDCSGYVQYVYGKFGTGLPRDSYGQFGVGGSVGKGDLQAGDLVFFNTNGPGASHVGIYVGGGQFVDASDSGVAVQSLAGGYWGQHYVGARRVGK